MNEAPRRGKKQFTQGMSPRRGSQMSAQGSALGIERARQPRPVGAKAYALSGRDIGWHRHIPRTLSWADSSMAFQAVRMLLVLRKFTPNDTLRYSSNRYVLFFLMEDFIIVLGFMI